MGRQQNSWTYEEGLDECPDVGELLSSGGEEQG